MAANPSTGLSPELTAQEPVPAVRELDRSLVHGVAWTGGAKWVAQLLQWASMLIVARLLTPDDYGLVGMASVYLGLVTLVSEFSLGAAVLTLRDLSEDQIAQLYGLSVLFGVGSFAVSCAVAIPLGGFFHAPELPTVVLLMSSTFVITAFQTVPFSLLQRDLRFRSLALIETGRAAFLAVTMIAFAVLGLRYWTLVIGSILSATFSTGVTLAARRHRLAWPHRSALADAVTFSRRLLVARLSWYWYSNADFLIAGRILGQAALGVYSFAWTLANIPIVKIASLVDQVTPAVFSAVQKDSAALRRYLLGITEGLTLITLPASLGMALVAPDFVTLVLGDHWQGTIVPLQLLALSVSFRCIAPLLSDVLMIRRETRRLMYYVLLWAVVLPVGFYLFGSRWGTVGLALVWVVVFPVLALPVHRRALKLIELPIRDYLRALWPAVSASLLMGVSVLVVQWTAGEYLSPALGFAAQVVAGVAVYALACVTLHAERLAAFSRVLRATRAPRPATEGSAS